MQDNSQLTLIQLVSEQVWPQIFAVNNEKPQQVIFVHSEDLSRSRRPAERLKAFFSKVTFVGIDPALIYLEEVPAQDFNRIDERLSEILDKRGLQAHECKLNFTGGNKLMATAAFRWAMDRQIPAFYQEREGSIYRFKPEGRNIVTSSEKVIASALDDIDPLWLAECQLESASIKNGGELLVLNDRGRKAHENDLIKHLQDETKLYKGGSDFRKWLDITDKIECQDNEGTNFEYGAAVLILKLGVKSIRRSIRLQSEKATRLDTDESELDLVFVWRGQLWMVDCKDKWSGQNRVEDLKTRLQKTGHISSEVYNSIEYIKEEFASRDIHQLRQDLQSAAEIGGLRCRAVAMRSEDMPVQAKDYARSRQQIEIITKKDALLKWKKLLGV
jgi:hypothetical protein